MRIARPAQVVAVSVAVLFTVVLALGVRSVPAQGFPGIDKNKCLAGKTKCVSKKIAGLLKCHEKCQKNPSNCGQKQTDCETKVMEKFDGGDDPSKGCFAKLESKADPAKPDTVCFSTGNTAIVEAQVDACVADLVTTLGPCCDPKLEFGTGNNPICLFGHECCGSGSWQCDDSNGTTCGAIGQACVTCCDPALEPATGGNPICFLGHECCTSGLWQCNDINGSTCGTIGEACVP